MQSFSFTFRNGLLRTPAYKSRAAILYQTGFQKRLTTFLHIKDVMEPLDIDYLQLKEAFPNIWSKYMKSGRDIWQFVADHSIWGILIDKAIVDGDNYAWEIRYFDQERKAHTRTGMCEERKSAYNQLMFAVFSLIQSGECFDWRFFDSGVPNDSEREPMTPEMTAAYVKTQEYLGSITKAANDRAKRNKFFRSKGK